MPSPSEVPSGGAKAFGYFALFKVTRCKSGTKSGRYRSNGYVLRQQSPTEDRGHASNQAGCQAAFVPTSTNARASPPSCPGVNNHES
ncbi:hypothetical protein PSUM_09565 [Pseudomonas umsongensis]|uniref:Uncharacterized protein n=1 Tax=Pseudomonas umsongensis TaxID=198618 RepID=A0ABX4E3B3_9PSED|nr:hypothetical protein PSUM_09565 [Pseudomonas umsongensis]